MDACPAAQSLCAAAIAASLGPSHASHLDLIATADEAQRALPFGWIFGAFMVAVMLGSTLFQVASRGRSVESVATACYGIAALCLFAPLLTDAPLWAFGCFVVFEICCGVHFPLISTLRSRYVPEEARAALMSIYRVPLNLTVATVLVKVRASPLFCLLCGRAAEGKERSGSLSQRRVCSQVADMQLSTVLGICGCLLLLCSALASTLRPPVPAKATAV